VGRFLPRLPERQPRETQVAGPRTPHKIYPSIRQALRIGNSKALLVFSNHSIILYDTSMRFVPAPRLGPLRVMLLAALAVAAQGAKTLDIYFIDVEGGQSTLVVPPSGQALLIDTGYAGNSGRDANRIAAAAKA